MNDINVKIENAKKQFLAKFDHLSVSTADTLQWLAVVVLNLVFVPSILAVMSGLSDRMPPLDIALLVWISMLFLFVRSAILKDMLMVITIGVGFMLQVVLLGLTFFI